MVQFDNQYRQIKVKIVYYGPALGGKTTCLQHIHHVIDPQRRTKLYSLNTASDRTLFFDLLSLNLGRIRGYRLAVQLYTVPGQVQYNATRRAVLSGADGVVFVADSQVNQRQPNLDSLENLADNLSANGLDLETIPLVFQYNKRDSEPLLAIDDLERTLNRRQQPAFPSVAITGDGVMETFAAISEHTLAGVADRLGVGSSAQAVNRLQQQVREALRPFTDRAAVSAAADDVEVTTPLVDEGPDQALSPEALVTEAVRTNMAMTDLTVRLETVGRQLERKVEVLAGIAEFGKGVANERDPRGVLRTLRDDAVRLLEVQAAAILIVPRSGSLREELLEGVEHDPLLATVDGAGEPVVMSLVEEREPRLLAGSLDGDQGGAGFQIEAVEAAGYGSAVVVPMIVQDRIVGVLTAYANHGRQPLDEDDLQLATVLASSAATAYANAEAWRQLEESHKDLSEQVVDRTEELRTTLEQVQQLADDLTSKNRLLEEAYRELSDLDRVKGELMERVSTQLKTPVGAVLNAAKLLVGDKPAPDERNARLVAIIRDEAHKLSALIDSVVQASMLPGSGQRPELEDVPAEELLRRVIAPLRDLAQQRGVRLNILVATGLKNIACDPKALMVALRAVVKNAIEFSQDGGTVKLEVRRMSRGEERWLAIRVVDGGVGIAESELERVFDAFWKGSNASDDRLRGLGLGLTLAKRIVENHGGAVTVTSRLGEGTEVTVTVPRRVD
jgi:signal transduction histidine kinase/signal recognition particle receptor subunit beta